MTGHTLGHYRIAEKIDVRGVCELHCTHVHQLNCGVALKILPPGPAGETARQSFRKEARALPRRNHPDIETVFELSTQNRKDFLAMALILASAFRERAQTRTACPWSYLSPG